MTSDKDDTSKKFNRAVANEAPATGKSPPVPDMIKKDQPVPRPRPPAVGRAVDAEIFNRRWEAQNKAARNHDPFDKIDERRAPLRNRFNARGDPFDKADKSTTRRGQERE